MFGIGLDDWLPVAAASAAPGYELLDHTTPLANCEPKRSTGPIVFQLPPRWGANPERLEVFLSALPIDHRYAFELRDPSWQNETIYSILRRHNAALCIFDIGGQQSPVELTTDFTYIRLHGPHQLYTGGYSDEAIATWGERIIGWSRELSAVHLYFDNDIDGSAPIDAERLRRAVGLS